MKNRFNSGFSSEVLYSSPNGTSALDAVLNRRVESAKRLILFVIYSDKETPSLTIQERDNQISLEYDYGEKMTALARKYALSVQRISQIVKHRR